MSRKSCVDLKEVCPHGSGGARVVDVGLRTGEAGLLLRGAVPEPPKGFEDVRHRLGGGQTFSGRKKGRGPAQIHKSAGTFQAHLPVGKRALGGRGGQRCFRTRVTRVRPDGGAEAMDGRLGAVEHLQEAALCVSEKVRNAVSAAPAAALIRSRSLANPLPSKWTRGRGRLWEKRGRGTRRLCTDALSQISCLRHQVLSCPRSLLRRDHEIRIFRTRGLWALKPQSRSLTICLGCLRAPPRAADNRTIPPEPGSRP